jgi:hypothetical protein
LPKQIPLPSSLLLVPAEKEIKLLISSFNQSSTQIFLC